MPRLSRRSNRVLLVIAVLAVFDGAHFTSAFDIPMVLLGGFAIAAHFTRRYQPLRMERLRFVALIAIVAIAGATLAKLLGSEPSYEPNLRLLAAWIYWLALAVVVAEQSADVRFRKAMVVAIGLAGTIVAGVRILEALAYQNFASGEPILMTRNGYGAILSLLAPLAVVAWSYRSRAASIVCSIGFMLALGVNASRGSWLAAIVGASAMGVGLVLRGRRTSKARTAALALLLVSIVGMLGLATSESETFESIQERANSFRTLDDDLSALTRLALQDKALSIVSTEPLIGVGLGNFTITSIGSEMGTSLPVRYWQAFGTWTAHNSYLELLSEVGLLGSLPILAILAFAAFASLRLVARYPTTGDFLSLGISASVLSLAAHLWLKGGLGSTLPWLIIGLLLGVVGSTTPRFLGRTMSPRGSAPSSERQT